MEEADNQALDPKVFQAVCDQADKARRAQELLAQADSEAKNELLTALADTLLTQADLIEAANSLDMRAAFEAGMDQGKLDRLRFDRERIGAAAQAVRQVASLPDPIGEVIRGYRLSNGMRLNQVRVPMGLIGIIYEARPNVTVDVSSLCLKSGNAVLLRGGHAARQTNETIIKTLGPVLRDHGFSQDLVSSVDPYGRQGAKAMMRARGHIDLLVPRGGAGLIQSVVRDSSVPVIETGAGNVHIYVDRSADLSAAIPIVLNAKTQRVGVCNAAEKLLVHRDVAQTFLPQVAQALSQAKVALRSDQTTYDIISACSIPGLDLSLADREDWDTEYLALKMGVMVVGSLDEAIAHINRHSTGHTEAILAEDYRAIEAFTARVDSAVVIANASTRFTDGGVFGFGAELGIATQKLHARGPMGLREMTTSKWIGYGSGQVRP
ncbi:glutamate-5-semialdehyde dehydrogenase [Bifidobacterium aemilianum]|uniref:Gamma-glutamyl phosphate reductase n=1 Tax=Bifidobacterium aemilianum TaxID=2493120 RepID=A0A366KAX9_9BIFI|nr:glutamate-5-semialdehyde dehydrogenase [Bifidobacterium aemilianum]RBP98273.1 glutamate-5-semialdehyde dehydrogenase [Bifidobacterium aemilianum]